MSNATLPEESSEPSAAGTEVAAPEAAGPACEKCGFANEAAACPKCGWYPVLGLHVEIDDAFEAIMQAPAAVEGADAEAPTDKAQPEWQKHLAVWQGLIPGWAWLMIGTTLGVVAAAIAGRVASLENSALQTTIGVTGLIAGASLAVVMHLVGFILCSSDDADLAITHVVIKPLVTWKRLLAELPRRLWLANSANLGLTTALSAALIVGGIPYEKLLDWKFKAAPKKNLIASIAQQAAKNGDDKSMEEAMNDFADKAVGELNGDASPKPPVEKPRQKLECLVIGYQVDKDDKLTKLLLAADSRGKLKYIGAVRPKLDADETEALMEKFAKARSTRPFIRTTDDGVWLRPKFTCRVTYTEWAEGSKPRELKWDTLLDEVKLPW